MRWFPVALAALLSGCLQSVEVPGLPDGSAAPLFDGALPVGLDAAQPTGLDASTLPGLDASSEPGLDAASEPRMDAANPAQPDSGAAGCTGDLDCLTGQICVTGCDQVKSCVPGCWTSASCAAGTVCENVDTKCGQTYGTCVAAPSCTDDSACPIGSTCDFSGIGGTKECVPGCHSAANCPSGDTCLMPACPQCADCPCVGTCEPPATGCATDADCNPAQTGEVCGTTFDLCTMHCSPGCHEDAQCRPDQTCETPGCASACGCDIGTCFAKPATCQTDTDCPASPTGQVQICMDCGSGNTCVPGCHTSSQCPSGQECGMVMCAGGFCCPNQCEPTPASCSDDYQCGVDEICEYANHTQCSGTKTCQKGCDSDGQCAIFGAGSTCTPTNCGACCPGSCSIPTGCTADSDCAKGSVCEFGAGCTGTKSCVPGCHTDAQCGAGESCFESLGACFTCPCPGTCVGTACAGGSTCSSDLDCPWDVSKCTSGCCTPCPVLSPPPCASTKCSYGEGVDTDGCAVAPTCATCCSCPANAALVCGTNYQTYACQAAATCASATVLHSGACLPYEGMGCGYNTGGPTLPCGSGEYCRDTCPYCDSIQPSRCTQNGACVLQEDCPAGLTATCTTGSPVWTCTSGACQFTCQ